MGGWGRRNHVLRNQNCKLFCFKQNIGREAAQRKWWYNRVWTALCERWIAWKEWIIPKIFRLRRGNNLVVYVDCQCKFCIGRHQVLKTKWQWSSALYERSTNTNKCPHRDRLKTKLPRPFAPYVKQKRMETPTNAVRIPLIPNLPRTFASSVKQERQKH